MEQLVPYFLSITPAFVVFVLLLVILPRELTVLRITVHLVFFVLARDAMTPQGLWQVGAGSLRLTGSETALGVMGLLSLSLVGATYAWEARSRAYVRWFGARRWYSLAYGAGGAALIATVAAGFKAASQAPSLPAPAQALLPTILLFALAGNAYEEFLFRGLLQGYLQRHLTAVRAALASGLLFCLCHAFLAVTVTQVGTPILVFTLLEGVVAGLVCVRAGVLGATLAHGGAVFILASGWT